MTQAPATPSLVERLADAGARLNPLTRYGEDAVWRPATRAQAALTEAMGALEAQQARIAELEADTSLAYVADLQALADRYEKALREIAAGSFFVLDNRKAVCWQDGDPYTIAERALSSSQGRHEGRETRNIERLPASDLTDRELLEEQGRVEKLWDQMHEPDEDGELFEGHGGSPGEWMVERMDEIATEQARRAALPSPNHTNPEAEHG